MKPKVILNCVADHYARGNKRIVEFSGKVDGELEGGLISIEERDGALHVEVYRCSDKVVVRNEMFSTKQKGDSVDSNVKKYVMGFYVRWSDDHHYEVLLVRKNKPEWQAGKLNGIGGHIEPGEEPKEAMIREFLEETGECITNWEFVCMLEAKGDTEQEKGEVYVFRSDIFLGPIPHNRINDEGEEFALYNIEQMPSAYNREHVLPNVRWLLEMTNKEHKHNRPFFVQEKSQALQEVR